MASDLYCGLETLKPLRRVQLEEDRMAPYIDAAVCDNCSRITVEALISANGYRLHSIAAAKVAAGHCSLCKLIVHDINDPLGHSDRNMIVMRVANTNGTPYCQDVLIIQNDCDWDDKGIFTLFGLYTDEGDVAGELIPGRRMAQRPEPAYSVQLARTWIDSTKEDNNEDFDLPKALPKRLIDVGHRHSPTVHLRDFSEAPRCDGNIDEQKGRYVCLSHRWDDTSDKCTTTSDNIDARKESIQLSSLPPTFQDAILITRALEIQYIWIDTLCIVQGSKPDWAKESATMGSYYGSSWLTIGAGVPSAEGLFGERQFNIPYLKVDLLGPGNSRLYFTHKPVNMIIDDEQSSILRSRAWTCQEEILSPRYLGFQSDQMCYRCGEYMHYESGYMELQDPPDGTEREMTDAGDRLPAISGIAHERQRLRGGDYVAGLWKEDLPQDLCWSKRFAKNKCSKPANYRAPSWSWAAIDGKIDRANLTNVAVEADVVHVSTTLEGADPMGAVSGGLLVICGVFRPGMLSTEQGMSSFDLRNEVSITRYDYELSLCGDTKNAITYTFVPDTSDFERTNTTIWFLNITHHLGLALIPISSSHPQYSMNTYERIGLIQIKHWDRNDDSVEKAMAIFRREKFRTTITII